MSRTTLKHLMSALAFFVMSIALTAQSESALIVIDQFGYRTDAQKIAIIKNPILGVDAGQNYVPADTFKLFNADNNSEVYQASINSWNAGALDSASGDKCWTFDFSTIQTSGNYYILDPQNNLKSYTFEITANPYQEALKTAFKTFFYQRSGHAKSTPFAETGYADGASHIGNLQDKNCRYYADQNNASLEIDVHGGWYDAGDYNKYTHWTGNYIIELLKTYQENPGFWGDDLNIPESGNGVSDLLDEIKWGMNHLLRLQKGDGSMISIVSADHASPPSSATGQSFYGEVNTSATLKSCAAFALGATVFRSAGLSCYADTLQSAAEAAWNWADNNPAVVWSNNSSAWTTATQGGGGDMEVDDYGRTMFKLQAATFLFELTENTIYRDYFDANYTTSHLIEWYYTYPFEHAHQETMLHYTSLNNTTASTVNTIKSRYLSGINGANSFGAVDSEKDPYRSYIEAYVWGSNGTKCNQGLMFHEMVKYGINPSRDSDAMLAAENYVHYIHGLNPLNKNYLSNMTAFGAENSVNEFYHSWFAEGSADWDKVGVSTYGPAPGYVVGGPNPGYSWAACCDNNSCGSPANNALCSAIDLSPVQNQPAGKSYMDFNHSWPINSWEITENSNGYQVAYLRLLNLFVSSSNSAISSSDSCNSTNRSEQVNTDAKVFPNPSSGNFTFSASSPATVQVYSTQGQLLLDARKVSNYSFGDNLAPGQYLLKYIINDVEENVQLVKQ